MRNTYYVDSNIPNDVVVSRRSSEVRQKPVEREDEMRQLRAAFGELKELVLAGQAQAANQLAEVIARLGQTNARLAAVEAALEEVRGPRSVRRVTEKDVQSVGGQFWTHVDSDGTRSYIRVERVPGHRDDGFGKVSYDVRRTDREKTQGPPLSRPLSELFFTEEDASNAPRTSSSAKQRKASIRRDKD